MQTVQGTHRSLSETSTNAARNSMHGALTPLVSTAFESLKKDDLAVRPYRLPKRMRNDSPVNSDRHARIKMRLECRVGTFEFLQHLADSVCLNRNGVIAVGKRLEAGPKYDVNQFSSQMLLGPPARAAATWEARATARRLH